jgi:hypothetical protein
MGDIWARALPDYLAKWKVPFILRPGWEQRSRRSGGFNSVLGIGIHHDASSTGGSPDSAYQWSCINCPTKPVGNGSLGRDGTFQLWAAGAANTMGQGGALRVSRGTIALNDGNATMFAIEAGNNGIGEPWTAAQIVNYPLLCAAVLDWATQETPGPAMSVNDIFAHWEYCQPSCPGRKIDPAGPSPWLPSPSKAPKYKDIWDMDKFRADVAKLMAPKPTPKPPHHDPTDEDNMVIYTLADYTNTWSQQGIALSPEAFNALVFQGAQVVVSDFHGQHIKSLLAASGLVEADLDPRTG